MDIILIILLVVIVACLMDKKGYVSYEYGDNAPNYTAYTVDDTLPIVNVKDGDILLTVKTTGDMFDCINDLKNTCENDKVYFYCQNIDKYIEFDMNNNQNKFRYVRLDHPPM